MDDGLGLSPRCPFSDLFDGCIDANQRILLRDALNSLRIRRLKSNGGAKSMQGNTK